ncbi:MAG TPA: aldehyde dehydrogenase family protein [Ktedonobacterales bacterium]
MRVAGGEHDDVTQPGRLELIGRRVQDAAVGQAAPAVLPAPAPGEQAGSLQFTMRQPLGVVGVISPWNFPVAIPLWKIAPALAFGNTVVWKPAEGASLTATRIVEVFAAADLPAGSLNLMLGKGSVVGAALARHTGVAGLTFTGSDTVGRALGAHLAARNAKYQLEMGGKNAALVLADADLEQAASLVAAGAMRYAGQKCTATSRVYRGGKRDGRVPRAPERRDARAAGRLAPRPRLCSWPHDQR